MNASERINESINRKQHPTSRLFIFLCDSGKDSREAGLSHAVVAQQHHSVNAVRVALRVVVRVRAPLGAVVEGLVSGVVGRRLSQGKVATLGGAGGEPGILEVPGPRRVLVEVGGRNRRAASAPQGLLRSLGVEGHVATAMASGQA